MFDVVVGTALPNRREFFADTVTVAYRDGRGKQLAVVETETEPIERSG